MVSAINLIVVALLLAIFSIGDATTDPTVFDVDCVTLNLENTDCQNYVVAQLTKFINDGHYSRYNLPIRLDTYY